MSVVRFGNFMLDPGARLLTRGGEPVHLTAKALDLLVLLATRRPDATSKKDIHQHLWPDTFVSDVSLTTLVFEVRTALGESARTPQFLRTVHGFGYAFQAGAASSDDRSAESPFRIVVADREVMLRYGENLIGRARDCVVRLDATRVSRHHARITIDGDTVLIEDCGSRHGTLVGGKPIEGRVRLKDGDAIDIAGAELVFSLLAASQGTETSF
ncbi:MAG: FHA domain-containing protein [Vicinamibacterales bacterium]